MAFFISYRDPRAPTIAGATIVGCESQIAEATERLRRQGYEVTHVTPPPVGLILEGKSPPLETRTPQISNPDTFGYLRIAPMIGNP
jgi:hypothetical protein